MSETEIIRPERNKALDNRVSGYSPEILRMQGINKLMGPPDNASLCRITREQIILEALILAAEELGMKLPATKTLIFTARELSPGLDGLGRGEAVKCLVAHAQAGSMPAAAPFMQDDKPGIVSRLISFMKGRPTDERR